MFLALFPSYRKLLHRVDLLETHLRQEIEYTTKLKLSIPGLIEDRLALYDKHRDDKARERIGLLDGTQADVEHLRLENARGLAEDQGLPAEIRNVDGEERLIVGHPLDFYHLNGEARGVPRHPAEDHSFQGGHVERILESHKLQPTIVDQVDAVLCERAREARSPRHGGYSNGQGR